MKLRDGYDADFHLGVPFFTAYYTIFDVDNQEISLAKVNKQISFSKASIDTHSEVVKSGTPTLDTEDVDACTSDDFCWELLKNDKSDKRVKLGGDSASDKFKKEYVALLAEQERTVGFN